MNHTVLSPLARIAAKAQERACNIDNDAIQDAADKAVERFEEAARDEGYEGVRWPGLYPQVKEDGRWIDILV